MTKLLPLLLALLLLTGCAETYSGPTRTEWVIGEFTKEQHSPWTDYVQIDRIIYSYDILGNLAQTLEYRDGEEKIKTVYTFDDRGNLLTETRYSLSGWFPKRIGLSEYTYDEQNRITSEAYDQSGTRTEIQYIFDDEARTRTKLTNGEVTMVTTYDENGEKLAESGGTGDYWYQDTYTRRADGKLLTEHIIDSEGNEQFRRIDYDSHGSTVCVETIRNGVQTLVRDEYEYDEQGRPVRQFRLTDTSRTLVRRWEYLDENGSVTLYDPDGTPNCTILYDERGNQISLVHYQSGTDQVGIRETTTYIQIQVPMKEDTP